MLTDRLITVAIHTYDRAHRLKGILEQEGISVYLQNVNLTNPSISAGIRVRIKECDLPHALRIIENIEILSTDVVKDGKRSDGMSILVPVDFSDNSLKACIAAFRIAASINASIHLLHSYIDPAFNSPAMMQLTPTLDYESENEAEMIMDEKLDRDLYNIARKGMADFENRLRDKVRHGVIPGVSFQSTVTEGLPEESIDNYCSSHHISLVVMGTNGADSSTRNNLGSITAEVLDNCRTPVMTVPASTSWIQTGKEPSSMIFIASDSQQDILALDSIYRIFPDISLKVTIMHLPDKRKARQSAQLTEGLIKYCKDNFPAYTFRVATAAATDMNSELESLKPDIIAVANRKKNIFIRLFNPTIAHKILFHTSAPLLSIPVNG